MKKTIISLVLCLLMAAPALCETSVWIAQTDSSVTYIGGTIHFLRETDLPLPPEFDKAYAESEVLVFETDLTQLNSPAFEPALTANATYTDGRTLDSVLSNEAYIKLEEYCTENSIPVADINQFKPWMIMMMFMGMEMQKRGIFQEGVDAFYYNKAMADLKSVEKLETVIEQIEVITTMGDGNESEFIIYSIDDLIKLDELFDKLVAAWKTGDMEGLGDMFVNDVKREFPKLYKSLFVDRNNKWVPKIERFLADPKTEFVLVGTGHLVGEDGVITQLIKLGYKVEKFK
ncbi:MAG: TraB/GumN family protein [candidate division Zixibacteria bacterium]|nr:TraB/GumN family protein [candidate division Zixibacteria bacterium]